MQLILDNLVALLVSATLAVMLLSQQASNRQDTLERQSVYSAKVQAVALAEWLEDDIVNLGARFGDDRNRFSFRDSTVAGLPYTAEFVYHYNEGLNPDGTADRVGVRYKLVRSDSVLVAVAPRRYMPLYRLRRDERAGRWLPPPRTDPDGEGSWVDDNKAPVLDPAWIASRGYGSPHGLSYFHLEPRRTDGTPVRPEEAAEADYVRLEFSVIPTLFPVHRARFVREAGLNWASTVEIRPF